MTDGIAAFQSCSSEDNLALRLAAEFANTFGVPSDYYVLEDQVERQPPGPGPVGHDPLFGEPSTPIRPEDELDQSSDNWIFTDPIPVSITVSAYQVSREITPSGSTTVTSMQVALPAASLS